MRTREVDRNEKSVWWELGASGFEGRADQKGNSVPPVFAPPPFARQVPTFENDRGYSVGYAYTPETICHSE